MPGLFEPLRLRGVTLRNRVVMAPMDQLAAVDGGSAGRLARGALRLARRRRRGADLY